MTEVILQRISVTQTMTDKEIDDRGNIVTKISHSNRDCQKKLLTGDTRTLINDYKDRKMTK